MNVKKIPDNKVPAKTGSNPALAKLRSEMDLIASGHHHAPFTVLGNKHNRPEDFLLFYSPDTVKLTIGESKLATARIEQSDFFYLETSKQLPEHYSVNRTNTSGEVLSHYDPYSFEQQLSDFDAHLFSEGRHLHIYKIMGAHHKTIDAIEGILFTTWAPNANRVSVTGDFNHWDGRRHPMRSCGGSGIWELFIPGLADGSLYKYEIRNRQSGNICAKADPYAQQSELRPHTASVSKKPSTFQWQDKTWLASRTDNDWLHAPLSIYECHLGSWQRGSEGEFLNYRELAHMLVDYVKDTGFTHIELLPITEHPLDASWGYQTTGYFAATRRFGEADDFRYFVDYCHQHNIGVLLDWVPAHFPKDEHGLAFYDGSALYEHEDPRRGEHRDWGTLIYNYERNEVRNFLISNAVFWMEEYHLDGLRVDAVASMLYLDYSREEHDWLPNIHGGNENIGAIEFMRELNTVTHTHFPGTLMMAEESTSWPQVTRPTDAGGLGFSMKWNMGWMHDTLDYVENDPIYRNFNHQQLTFGLLYAFTENFILPFSHDEVVHGKRSLLYKMPGDEWQRFANLRLLYSYMFTYPGKKLLFMGCEFGHGREWNHDQAMDWYLLQYPYHSGVKKLVYDLNTLYKNYTALHLNDFDASGFEWLNCDDSEQSVLSYMRKSDTQTVIIVLNFTPEIRENYRLGLPDAGEYKIILNSDSDFYSGSNTGGMQHIHSENIASMNRAHSIQLTLPPLAALIIEKIT